MDEKIKVLQVMDHCAVRGSPVHGVTRLLLSWAPEFKNTNVELSLCVLRSDEGTQGFSRLGVPLEVLGRGKLDPRTIFDLIRIIKRDKIQILHCHGYGSSTFGRITGLITGCPVIIHEHMIDPDIPFYQKIADKILFPFTAKGVAVSNAVKTFMSGVRSIPDRKIQVIHNCIPGDYCNQYTDEQKNDYAKKYNIPEDKLLVGTVGRLDPLKAHTDFLLAAKEVLKVVPETCFIIVGEGALRSELEGYAQQLGIKNDVLFPGYCENVKEIISLFDLFAMSSLTEGFGLSIAEAMAQSKPVVATSVGGVPEVVVDGENGFLVPAKSPDQLAAKIIKLLCDEQLRQKFAAKALAHCQESFLAPVPVGKLSKLYSELL